MKTSSGASLFQLHIVCWKNCPWTGGSNTELLSHIASERASQTLADCVSYYHGAHTFAQRLFTAVNYALRVVAQALSPFACLSIDRRCLYELHSFLSNPESVQSLICFSCACSIPYIHGDVNSISMHSIMCDLAGKRAPSCFLGMLSASVEAHFGLETY